MIQNFTPKFLVLHYTELNFKESMNILNSGSVSAHYLVPTSKDIDPSYEFDELFIHSLVGEDVVAWHAGSSSWQGFEAINNHSIGIEIVNLGVKNDFEPYPEEQINKVIELSTSIIKKYNILPDGVVGHSDISPGRKIDPGPNFPWHELYKNGIGAWYDEDTKKEYLKKFQLKLPNMDDFMTKLREYGYSYCETNEKEIISAFQMHFRADRCDGVIDAETAAIIYSLHEKYKSKHSRHTASVIMS